MPSSSSAASPAVSVKDLVKVYPGNLLAIDKISFDVSEGEIFGFLGLNGAGKTTTIKILTTLIPPTSGSVNVLGYDVVKEGIEVRKRIGVVQQKESYDRNLTVLASLKIYASIWDIPRQEVNARIEDILKRFGLEESKNRKIRWLSFGQRRRLQVAREFLHESSLLVLDEPTAGLDVLARHSFLELCKERSRKRKQTLFFTTHIVSEAEYLCDRIALIHKGQILALDSPKELKAKYGGLKTVSIVLRNAALEVTKARSLCESLEGIKRVEVDSENILHLTSDNPFKLANDASTIIETNGYEAESISINEPSLEDVIFRLVGGESN